MPPLEGSRPLDKARLHSTRGHRAENFHRVQPPSKSKVAMLGPKAKNQLGCSSSGLDGVLRMLSPWELD